MLYLLIKLYKLMKNIKSKSNSPSISYFKLRLKNPNPKPIIKQKKIFTVSHKLDAQINENLVAMGSLEQELILPEEYLKSENNSTRNIYINTVRTLAPTDIYIKEKYPVSKKNIKGNSRSVLFRRFSMRVPYENIIYRKDSEECSKVDAKVIMQKYKKLKTTKSEEWPVGKAWRK